jgi:hypothetical protein
MTDIELQDKLTRLGSLLDADARLADRVLDRIGRRVIAPAPAPTRWSRGSAGFAAALAATVLLGVGLWLAIGGGDGGSLYAQVVQALAEVRTVHFVATNFDEHRTPSPAGEGWYERGVGIHMTVKVGLPMAMEFTGPITVYDDGKQMLTVTAADPTPRRAASVGLSDALTMALLTDRAIDGAARDAAGDMVIDGDRCRMFFRRSDHPGTPSGRYWIDAQNRVRRVEHVTSDDHSGWRVLQRVEVQYDVPVDRSLLVYTPPTTAIASTTKPIDIDATVNQLLSLDRAILTKEVFGLILAVHEVRPCTDGSILVLSSLRPTKATLEKYGTGFGPRALGDHDFTFSTGGGTTYYSQQMAQYESGRLYARWDLLVPTDPPATRPETLSLRGDVWTRDRLYDDLIARHQTWYANELAIGDVPVPPATSAEPLDALVSRVWRQAQPLHTLFSPVTFPEPVKPNGDGKFELPTHPADWWTETKLLDAVRQEKQRADQQHQAWKQAHPNR